MKHHLVLIISLIIIIEYSSSEGRVGTELPERSNSFVVFDNCTACYVYNFMVCVDSQCYCQPEYQLNPIQKTCIFKMCFSDPDCYTTQDIMRRCVNNNCICDTSYVEDWTNGRKCIYKISVWYWVWVFILVPIAVGVTLFIYLRRRKRMQQAHSHLIGHSEESPPSYGSQKLVVPYN